MSILLGGKYPPAPVPLWTPNLLTGVAALRGWFDANDASTIVQSGGSVSQWNDKSGAGRNLTQATGSAQPVTGTRTLNGKNVLDFNGSQFLSKTSWPVSNLTMAVYMVAVIDAIDNASDAVFSYAASKDFCLEAYNASQFNGRVYCVGASNPSPVLSGGPFAGPSIYNAKVGTDGFRIRAYIDGTQRADGQYVGGVSGSGTFRVFSCRSATCFPDGAVAEVIVIERATDAIRQQIEGYLAHKWGTKAKLPAGHPYQFAAPTA